MSESKTIPMVELVGPAGIIKVNDFPEVIAEWRGKGYVSKEEYSAKAQEEAGTKPKGKRGKGDEPEETE